MNDTLTLAQALLSGEAASLRNAMETVCLADGEFLFHRGEPGDAFYIIESGQVRIFTLDEGGRELTLNILGPGEAFGEMALVDDRPRSAGVVAIGPVALHRLGREVFLEQIHSSPALTQAVIQLLSERARSLTDYIERLGHWARLIAEGQYNQVIENIQDTQGSPDRILVAVADALRSMVQAVQEREERLRQEAAQLRIRIDKAQRERQVAEITETGYFRELVRRARSLRQE